MPLNPVRAVCPSKPPSWEVWANIVGDITGGFDMLAEPERIAAYAINQCARGFSHASEGMLCAGPLVTGKADKLGKTHDTNDRNNGQGGQTGWQPADQSAQLAGAAPDASGAAQPAPAEDPTGQLAQQVGSMGTGNAGNRPRNQGRSQWLRQPDRAERRHGRDALRRARRVSLEELPALRLSRTTFCSTTSKQPTWRRADSSSGPHAPNDRLKPCIASRLATACAATMRMEGRSVTRRFDILVGAHPCVLLLIEIRGASVADRCQRQAAPLRPKRGSQWSMVLARLQRRKRMLNGPEAGRVKI
jgi:hypothetical protein